MQHSYLFNTDPNVGFGAFPGPETNYTVTTGAFRNLIRGYPLPHHIQRHYNVTVSCAPHQQISSSHSVELQDVICASLSKWIFPHSPSASETSRPTPLRRRRNGRNL